MKIAVHPSLRFLLALASLLVGLPGQAAAQGVTRMCLATVNPTTGATNCVDISANNGLPVANTTNGSLSISSGPSFGPGVGVPGIGNAGYPPGSTPLGGTGTGTTGAATATLTPTAGTYAYVCGVNVLASATAAITTSNATIATLIGSGTVSFLQQVGATATPAATTYTFPQCVRANAISTAITLTTVAAGAGGSTTAYIWGFQQ